MGSAGQRHLRNLRRLAGKDLELFALRESRHNRLIVNGDAKECASLEAHYGLRSFSDLTEALATAPDAVFVTNPSSKHMPVALAAANAGADLFIEKPLSHSSEGIEDLKYTATRKRLVALVAFQTRFHPLYAELKAALTGDPYGKVVSAHFHWGTFLPHHHPYEDYRTGYAARRELGGGVVLGLIHELDLICSFWGFPNQVHSVLAKSPQLETNVEDTALALMLFENRGHTFPVSLHLTYAQVNEERTVKIQFERATLFCDWSNQSFHLHQIDRPSITKDFSNHSRNDLFLAEMREFLEARADRRQPSPGLADGIRSLKLAQMIKKEAERTS